MSKPRRISLNSLRNLNSIKKMIQAETLSRGIIQGLATKGEELINRAYRMRGWENRTYNLHDSYVSAVFVDGKLDESTIRFVDDGREMSRYAVDVGSYGTSYATLDPIQTNGREEALEFLRAYQKRGRSKQDRIQLVIGAAMFYSGILESKGYSVLANIEWDLLDLLRDGVYAEALTTTSIPTDGFVERLQIVDPRGTRFKFANLD